MDKNDALPWAGAYDDDRYPGGFLKEYEPFECLSSGDTAETLLVKNKRTGMFYVAKCYRNGNISSHAGESEILKKLHYTGLPRFVDEYRNDTMTCVVREYVEGTPLHQWMGERRPDAGGIRRVALSLCDLMIRLHGQTPPIIHRDIKPQNLIIGADGQLWLIDFGISRFYQEEANADTACWGTKDFAAPEQYGFAQTDVRSDIYSFGVLLGWMLTGEAARDKALAKITDRRMKGIVAKCTAFAPGERYPSAARLRADIAALDGKRRRRMLFRLGAAALCTLFLCAGFVIGRYTDALEPRQAGITFAEPLIEQAARLALGKADGEELTEAELLNVTHIFVYGNQPAKDFDEYHGIMELMAAGTPPPNGGIASLEDLKMMPNLNILFLGLQNIRDLTPLSSLLALDNLDLRHNPVSDLTPLAGLKRLSNLCLFETYAEDLSPLRSLPRLDNLDIGKTYVSTLDGLRGNGSIRYLWLTWVVVDSLDGIETLTGLEEIELSGVTDGDLTPLLALPRLKEAWLGRGMQTLAEETLAGAEFEIIYY